MSEINKNIEIILSKYLTGEATNAEIIEAEKLISTDKECKAYFKKIKQIKDAAEENYLRTKIDADAAFNHFLKFTETDNIPNIDSKEKSNVFSIIYKIAAVIVIGAAIWSVYKNNISDSTNFTAITSGSSQILKDTLIDGSIITLNKNSKCRLSNDFGKKHRQLTLDGEAFFDVFHDSKNPFIIETSNIFIKVVGTSFNISSYPENDSVVVTVKSGTVEVYSSEKNTEMVILNKGECAIFNKTSKKFIKEDNTNPNFQAWNNKIIYFDRIEMIKVVKLLNEIYSTNISLQNKSLYHCILTADFNNQSIENILEVIAATLEADYYAKDSSFIITGEGCVN